MSTPPNPALDPRIAADILRAERRRGMLEDLADMGMALAKDICQRGLESPDHAELKHDPGRSFAAASRAVRLTLAMEARIDEQIVALRNGVVPAAKPWAADPARRRRPADDGRRVQAHESVREAVEREVGDGDESSRLLGRVHERLIEGEDYDALLDGDIDACIAAICADLGLDAIPSRRSKAASGTSASRPMSREPALAGLDLEPPLRTPRDCPSG